MSARLILRYSAKLLVKYKENNKKCTHSFPHIFKNKKSTFENLVSFESFANSVLDNANTSYFSKKDIKNLLW